MSADQAARKKLADRFSSNYTVEQDENGNSRLVTNARTTFDQRNAYNGVRAFNGKRNHNQGQEYRASQWQGARDRQREAYQGQTQADSRFSQRARVDGQTARDSQRQARADGQDYRTSTYGTSQSRLQQRRAGTINQRSGYVETQRGSFDNAPIITQSGSDGSEYTLDEVKRMLGKDKPAE